MQISQCMIVKNEEENIERALSWGKDIVCEQIVVDTGSTDRTVELAKSMGAKVYHFEWCNDFSAAKNYAIDQAKGDWIAFLDADEYFEENTIPLLVKVMKEAERLCQRGQCVHAVRFDRCNVDQDGKVYSISKLDRVFRNQKELRYENTIHESLTLPEGQVFQYYVAPVDLPIMHTGYEKIVNRQKAERNITLLKERIKKNPKDYDAWIYLGDAYSWNEQRKEALESWGHAIEEGMLHASPIMIEMAFSQWFRAIALYKKENLALESEIIEKYHKFQESKLTTPNVDLFLGLYYAQCANAENALICLEKAFVKMDAYQDTASVMGVSFLRLCYDIVAAIYMEKRKANKVVQYSILSLRMDRYQLQPLLMLLKELKDDVNTTTEQEVAFLKKLYDLSRPEDRLTLVKAAVKVEDVKLEQEIRRLMPREEQDQVCVAEIEAMEIKAQPNFSELFHFEQEGK